MKHLISFNTKFESRERKIVKNKFIWSFVGKLLSEENEKKTLFMCFYLLETFFSFFLGPRCLRASSNLSIQFTYVLSSPERFARGLTRFVISYGVECWTLSKVKLRENFLLSCEGVRREGGKK